MVSDGHGQLAAAWLDLRKEGTRLYGAFSKDGGATWSKNIPIYEAPGGTICQCCAPSLAAAGPGSFSVMFRNVLGGSRDLYTIGIKDGRVVSRPAKVGLGTWTINACPMDGGGLLYSRGRFISAWRRGDDVFLSTPISRKPGLERAWISRSRKAVAARLSHGRSRARLLYGKRGRPKLSAEQGGGFPGFDRIAGRREFLLPGKLTAVSRRAGFPED